MEFKTVSSHVPIRRVENGFIVKFYNIIDDQFKEYVFVSLDDAELFLRNHYSDNVSKVIADLKKLDLSHP